MPDVAPQVDAGRADPTAPPGAARGLAAAVCLVALSVADGLLCALAANHGIDGWLAVAVHGALIAAGVWALRRYSGSDCASSVIGLLLILLAGPLGAIAILLLAVQERPANGSQGLLEDWYRSISGDRSLDAASLIHEAVLTGRAIRPGKGGPRRFLEVMKLGTLPEKQALLGLMGLRYHSAYHPVLMLALRADEASVRAQAATVFVKVKGQFKSQLKQVVSDISHGQDPANALERVRSILECTQSGFIDPADASEGRSLAAALCERALVVDGTNAAARTLLCRALAASGEHEQIVALLLARQQPLDLEPRQLLADSLIALGRHRELAKLAKTPARAVSWTAVSANSSVS